MKYIRQKSLFMCLFVLVTAFGVLYTKQTEAAYPFGDEVLRYTFEDTATGTTTDGTTGTTTNSGTSGTTNDGLFIGNASTSAALAKFGSRSASFGEAGDYMKTGYASTTNPTTQSYSISLWIYKKEASAGCNTGDDDHFFGSSGQPSGSRFYIRCTGGNWGMRFGAAAAANATTGMLHQTWQNIVMVFDSANDQPKLYVDGVQRATSTVVSSYTIKGDFYVGNVNDTITTPGVLNVNEGSNAFIDEVAIYNRALSPSEIAEVYAYGTSPNQVTGLTATPYENKANLVWSSPGGTFTDYKVEYKESSSPTWLTFTDGVSSTTASTTVTGLSANTSYDFRVTSVNGVIEGTPSSTSTQEHQQNLLLLIVLR
jgi:hypothetical protein